MYSSRIKELYQSNRVNSNLASHLKIKANLSLVGISRRSLKQICHRTMRSIPNELSILCQHSPVHLTLRWFPGLQLRGDLLITDIHADGVCLG